MARRFTKLLLFSAAAVTLAIPASTAITAAQAPAAARSEARRAWTNFMATYLEQEFRAQPAFAVNQGRHEYDGQLPDWSETGLQNEVARLRSAISAALGLRSAPAHPRAEVRARLSDRPQPRRPVLDRDRRSAAHQPGLLHEQRARSVGLRHPALCLGRGPAPGLSSNISARSRARPGRSAPICARRCRSASSITARSAFGGFADYYPGDGTARFRRGPQSATAGASCAGARARPQQAMQGLADWLESQRRTATTNFALGADRFARMLRDTEMVDMPLAELEAIGRADLQPQPGGAAGGLRPLCARRDASRTAWTRMNAQQVGGRPGRRRAARSSPGSAPSSPRRTSSPSPAPRRRRSRKRRPTTGRTSPISTFRGRIETRPAVGLLYRAARSDLVGRGPGRLRAGRIGPAVHLGARSVARPLPQLPPRQPLALHLRAGVRRLRLRRRAGRIIPRR